MRSCDADCHSPGTSPVNAAWPPGEQGRGRLSTRPFTLSMSRGRITRNCRLISLAGISIWQEQDLVQLTNAAYGDIAASLLTLITTPTSDTVGKNQQRTRLESVVSRPKEIEDGSSRMPGWSQRGGRGRGAFGRGFGGQRCH